MLFLLYILAAAGCAISNGAAAVLQKVGADTEKVATSFNLSFIVSLLRNWPYVLGIVLDLAAWIFTLIAVRGLPLFVVQPIIAFSVVVTILIERYAFGRKLSLRTIAAIGLIVVGLVLIALQSSVEGVVKIQGVSYWAIALSPILLALLTTLAISSTKRAATTVLAAIAGVAFGGVAVCGRILTISKPYWHVLYSPTFVALIGFGLVGIAAFTYALQRGRASSISATMITFETLVPIVIGATLLGDTPNGGSWLIVAVGASIALIGTIAVTTFTASAELAESESH